MTMPIRQPPITPFLQREHCKLKIQCMRQNVMSNLLPTLDPDKVSSTVGRKRNHFPSTWYMALNLTVEQERRKEMMAAFNCPN